MNKKIIIIFFVIFVLVLGFFYFKENKSDLSLFNINKETQIQVEKVFVEKYIRDNIKDIATNNPVLGGSWYVVSVEVNSDLKSGEVVYEDGHIQSFASFEYVLDDITKNLIIKNFEVKE